MRKRRSEAKNTAQQNSMSFPITRQPSDTVFGALGGNHIDTQESATSSTMVYPPSQLSSVTGDVDPIAEADVYLAYNRDVQAEEILKEAKLNMPNRTDVYVKLMEIYVKRSDNEAFDGIALELHRQTDGAGSDWARARDLAREIGSTHALFNVSASAFAVPEAHKPSPAYNNNSLSFAPSSHAVQFQSANASPNSASNSAPMPAPAAGTGLIDFDLSSLTLDLPQNNNSSLTAKTEDPKLALAEEYLSIGDKAGARSLIQDVITHGDPTSLAAAQLMLSRIG
jgi:pilus assembly protein FimV